MPTKTLVVTHDASLRDRVQRIADKTSAEIMWVENDESLATAFNLHPKRVLVDLNVPWPGVDIVSCIANCRQQHEGVMIVAFLHEQAGELAIRASLAGADRIIPQDQLEAELEEVLST